MMATSNPLAKRSRTRAVSIGLRIGLLPRCRRGISLHEPRRPLFARREPGLDTATIGTPIIAQSLDVDSKLATRPVIEMVNNA